MAVKPLAFSFGEVRRSAEAAPEPESPREQLWIAARHDALALHALDPNAHRDRRPTVVVEPLGGRLRVVALNAAARSRGVYTGLDLNAAFAFSGAIRVLERLPRAELQLLKTAATVCHRFTPTVSLEPPESVLLEVRASLALFGGLERLRASLAEALSCRVPGFRLSVAPTPLAALWLARGEGEDALSPETLSSKLAPLPLGVTRWSIRILERLEGMGIATIGDCLRLPRDGFARRAGKACLEELDKALGKRADLRAGFETPQRLSFEVEMFDESTRAPVFVDAVARMVEQLTEELRIRQLQVKHLRLVFEHMRLAPTVHDLELLDSTSDRDRLFELLRDKIERIVLPAPVTALRLSTGPLEPAILEAGRLFKGEGDRGSAEAEARLVERLRGRLGEHAVHGVAPAADHRPERAWIETDASEVLRARQRTRLMSSGEAGSASSGSSPVERPLWLAAAPEPLRCIDGKPRLGDRVLRVLEGPERIESGWWDGQGISRDYYVALGPAGERLWIFCDRADRCWYLHGRFG